MSKKIILTALFLCFAICQGQVEAAAIIIDHNCTDISQIPAYWIQQAKANLRIGYGHTSHGSQLVTGIEAFRGEPGSLYYYTYSGWGLEPGLFLNDYWGNAGGADDLGNNGYLGWRNATITMLNLPANDRSVVMWSWCGGVSDNTVTGINTYLNAMNQLEQTYPGVKFIYMTGHLDGSGVDGNLHLRNQQIRAYCIANNKILFDFADIESYDPDGNYFLNQGADDGCYYDGGNWAEEWIAAHPGSELAQLAAGCSECAHSNTLNCILKGRAFWWMMARLAGWDGNPGPSISISSPKTSDTFGPGKQMTIAWTSSGITGNVRIKLVRADNSATYTVSDSVPYNGSPYYYTIPADMTPGSYFIRIKHTLVNNKSANFSIGTITVNAPAPGQVFSRGGTLVAEWTTAGITGNVKITLNHADGSGYITIAPTVPYNRASYEYTIPADLTTGSYFVRIKQGTANGKSGDFTIDSNPPVISVTSPTTGQTYPVGSEIPIQWNTAGFAGNVAIKLIRSDNSASYDICPGTPYNNSPYNYTIAPEVTPGTYFIRVKKTGVTSGRSADFSITESAGLAAQSCQRQEEHRQSPTLIECSIETPLAGASYVFSILSVSRLEGKRGDAPRGLFLTN